MRERVREGERERERACNCTRVRVAVCVCGRTCLAAMLWRSWWRWRRGARRGRGDSRVDAASGRLVVCAARRRWSAECKWVPRPLQRRPPGLMGTSERTSQEEGAGGMRVAIESGPTPLARKPFESEAVHYSALHLHLQCNLHLQCILHLHSAFYICFASASAFCICICKHLHCET